MLGTGASILTTATVATWSLTANAHASAPLGDGAAGESAYSNAWADVRGVNYVPSYSRNDIQTWEDYDQATVERELGYAQGVGFNAVRVFLNMFPWVADRDTFLSHYDHFVGACAAKGIKPLVVLFDDDFFDAPGVNRTSDIAPWLASKAYRNEKWMANPGMRILAEDSSNGWTLTDRFLADVAGGDRANDRRLLGFDVMNEPSRHAPFTGGLPGFISHVFNFLGNTTDVLFTVDKYAQAPADAEELETGLSWHNYWHYGQPQSCAANTAQICNDQANAGKGYLADAAKRGKPALVSEMGQFNCYCPAAHGWQAAEVGFIAWELMMNHDQFASFQGLVFKNGTFRNETERRCIAELATRTARTCPPIPPPPPPAGCSAATNCTWHGDMDEAFFTWAPANNPTAHCWNPWTGPTGTAGHLKYCDIAHATVAFAVPAGASSAQLVFKRGPDCGIMLVNGETIDTFSATVQWEATMSLELSDADLQFGKQFTVTVSGNKNSRASHDWVQIVGVSVYTNTA